MGQPVLAVEGKEGEDDEKDGKMEGWHHLTNPTDGGLWESKQMQVVHVILPAQILVYRNLAIWHHYLINCNLPKLQPISNLRSTLLKKDYFKKEKKMKRSQLQCCSNYNRNCVIVWLDLKSSTDERGGWWPKRLCLTYLKLWWLHGRHPCGAEADSWRPCCALLMQITRLTTASESFSGHHRFRFFLNVYVLGFLVWFLR